MGLPTVITSRKFVDRTGVVGGGTEYLMLEDFRGGIGKLEKLLTLLKAKFTPRALLRNVPVQKPDEPAVVLFTSGSEKAPKAVPLTHRNIISDIRSALDAFHVTGDDSLIGFLPCFHSFGLTVTCVLPVLLGARGGSSCRPDRRLGDCAEGGFLQADHAAGNAHLHQFDSEPLASR